MRLLIVRLLTNLRLVLPCQSGQVAVIFAFAVVMLFIGVGMGIDLWQAFSVKARLQSAVDAAALAIASTDRANYTPAQLQTRAQQYVTTNYPSAVLGTVNQNPGPTLSYGANANTIIVTAGATLPTTFMRIINVDTLSVTASGQAQAAYPNINFYLLLDSSPSMAIAATQAGIDTMVNNTSAQGGCAFGCHEVNPAADGLGNPNGEDNFALATNLGVTLRIDNLRTAAQNLMTTAQNTMTTYTGVAYQVAIYTFDLNFNTIQALTTDLTTASTAAGNIKLLTMCQNGVRLTGTLTKTGNTHSSTTLNGLASTSGLSVGQVVAGTGIVPGTTVTAVHTSSNSVTLSIAATSTKTGITVTFYTCTSDNDQETNYDNAMTNITSIMPTPGQGTNSPGDTPQEVLLIVTDGAEDEAVASCTVSGTTGSCDGTRQMSVFNPAYCTTLKNKGILIAVLYTEYLPLPTNAFYNQYLSQFQSNIGPTLQSCASPGLYTEVTTGGDISAALSALFVSAVNSVYLSR